MAEDHQEDRWVWVIVQDPEKNEQFLGQSDPDQDIAFIPAFEDKDTAQAAMWRLTRDPKSKYEAQAILFEEIAEHAAKNQFWLFLMDAEGVILEKLPPQSVKDAPAQ